MKGRGPIGSKSTRIKKHSHRDRFVKKRFLLLKKDQIFFHAVIIFGLGSDFSFQSILERFGNNFVLLKSIHYKRRAF